MDAPLISCNGLSSVSRMLGGRHPRKKVANYSKSTPRRRFDIHTSAPTRYSIRKSPFAVVDGPGSDWPTPALAAAGLSDCSHCTTVGHVPAGMAFVTTLSPRYPARMTETMKKRSGLEINRASVLTLWAAVVAEQLGFDRGEALTLGRALAGLNACSKGVSLGLFQSTPREVKEQRRKMRAEETL